jgi:predicted Rossmann fold flavoprotein
VTRFDVIVIGAGAAGLFAAMRAGQRGRRVLLLDHADEAGKKILISGGGRCNFTNAGCVPDRFISANPHFARSALARYTQHDFIALVRKHRIAFHEKTLGQLFCDGSAREIVAMLIEECRAGRVDLHCGQPIGAVEHADGLFRVAFGAVTLVAPALVIACGGPSIPKMGASGFAYDLARQFGLKVVQPRPALVRHPPRHRPQLHPQIFHPQPVPQLRLRHQRPALEQHVRRRQRHPRAPRPAVAGRHRRHGPGRCDRRS